MTVSKRLRYEVLRRDNHACRYCGAASPDVALTVDHVVATALGGSDDPSNLVTACKDCNAGKSSSSADAAVISDVDERAMRWSQAMDIAIERRVAELSVERSHTSDFDNIWCSWTVHGQPCPREANWNNSILRFLASGLDSQFLADAVNTAMGLDRLPASDKWRYFCGICWRELDTIRERAAEIAETGSTPPRKQWPFPYMTLFDMFLNDILEALGGDLEACNLANDALWRCFPETYQVYMERMSAGDDPDDAEQAAREELSSQSAYYMYNIGKTRTDQTVTT